MEVKVDQQVQQAYDQQYLQETSEWRELGARTKAQNIIDITHGLTFRKVLEVGAGDGSILKFLHDRNFAEELYALEISASGLEKIRDRQLTRLKEVFQFDGYKIPYEDNSFDLVILSHVLEHVEFERLLLREIKRVSTYQVIEVPRDFRFGIDNKLSHFLNYGHINIYTPTSLKFLLKSEGFDIKQEICKTYDADLFKFMGRNSKVEFFKQYLSYLFKKMAIHIPMKFFKETYCSTITVLCFKKDKGVRIF